MKKQRIIFTVITLILMHNNICNSSNDINKEIEILGEKINDVSRSTSLLLERDKLNAKRLDETFQTLFATLGEIKWLLNKEKPKEISLMSDDSTVVKVKEKIRSQKIPMAVLASILVTVIGKVLFFK